MGAVGFVMLIYVDRSVVLVKNNSLVMILGNLLKLLNYELVRFGYFLYISASGSTRVLWNTFSFGYEFWY